MDDFDDIKKDVKEIKEVLVKNTVQMAVYNNELSKHIQGVQDLNTRMIPIEDHVKFLRKLMHAMAWGLGICASAVSILKAIIYKHL